MAAHYSAIVPPCCERQAEEESRSLHTFEVFLRLGPRPYERAVEAAQSTARQGHVFTIDSQASFGLAATWICLAPGLIRAPAEKTKEPHVTPGAEN